MGSAPISITYTRMPWNDTIAAEFRRGPSTLPNITADLVVMKEGMNNNRIAYRYFPPDSCAIIEGCVKQTGWRRLLRFDANTLNIGSKPMHVGAVKDTDGVDLLKNNVYEWSPCHKHFHFRLLFFIFSFFNYFCPYRILC